MKNLKNQLQANLTDEELNEFRPAIFNRPVLEEYGLLFCLSEKEIKILTAIYEYQLCSEGVAFPSVSTLIEKIAKDSLGFMLLSRTSFQKTVHKLIKREVLRKKIRTSPIYKNMNLTNLFFIEEEKIKNSLAQFYAARARQRASTPKKEYVRPDSPHYTTNLEKDKQDNFVYNNTTATQTETQQENLQTAQTADFSKISNDDLRKRLENLYTTRPKNKDGAKLEAGANSCTSSKTIHKYNNNIIYNNNNINIPGTIPEGVENTPQAVSGILKKTPMKVEQHKIISKVEKPKSGNSNNKTKEVNSINLTPFELTNAQTKELKALDHDAQEIFSLLASEKKENKSDSKVLGLYPANALTIVKKMPIGDLNRFLEAAKDVCGNQGKDAMRKYFLKCVKNYCLSPSAAVK